MSLPCLKPTVNRTHCGRLGTCSCQKAASNAGKPARVDVCVTGLVEQHGSVPQGLHFEAEISCLFAIKSAVAMPGLRPVYGPAGPQTGGLGRAWQTSTTFSWGSSVKHV